jgi:hypothetical protein
MVLRKDFRAFIELLKLKAKTKKPFQNTRNGFFNFNFNSPF